MKIVTILLTIVLASSALAAPAETVAIFPMQGDWSAAGDLSWQAMVLSLQGLANRDTAHIYLLYPLDYEHPNTHAVLRYYQDRHHLQTQTIESVDKLVRRYKRFLKGYVVWDREVVPSLMVAFTVAGLEDALVVSDKEIPLAKQLGLQQIADFRQRFRGQTDAEIFAHAIDAYWSRCSRDFLVYLGEWCKIPATGLPGMVPGIADFAVQHRAFCTDLSTSPTDADEYVLADKLHADMNDYAYLFGWHSYCKDQEGEHLPLLSRHAMVVGEGVATLPNMSFHAHIPVTPGFEFRQKAQFNENRQAEDKVYITLIQSDGLGLGAWLRPGRGSIPYGWETNMEWIDLAPGLLQYYYETATDKDCFIGSLSGPGYMYPKSYLPDKLPGALKIADDLMKRLDLTVFGIMDYTEGNRYVGNVDLPKSIVDAYYTHMPTVKGFFNGYGPGNTYDNRQSIPFISYQYYADENLDADEMVKDFRELARLNPERPYFIPVHVREYNDVGRMKEVMDRLGSEYEVVNPVEFVIMAGKSAKLAQRFLDWHPDFSGRWQLDPKESRNVFASRYDLTIQQKNDLLAISSLVFYNRFIHHREWRTERLLQIGGSAVKAPDYHTRRMKHLAAWSDSVWTKAEWDKDGKTLKLISECELQTAQGTTMLTSVEKWRLSVDSMTLTIEEYRQSREGNEPVTVFVYRRQL